MIADCETCDRKQVPCKSCQESQRAICFICLGDIADPYCELRRTFACPICGESTPHHHSIEREKRAECSGCMNPACEDCFSK